ncbi:MAG: hypothetical protein V8T24_11195 [Roseburia hominis]
MEELVSLLRVYRRKKDLRDPKMPLQEGKRNEKSALAGLGGRKSCARPEKAEKTGLESDFHESDPNRRKISLHNAKKYALAGLERKKAVSDPHIAMQAGKTPEIFEEQVCGNRKKPSKSLPAG